MTDSSNLEAEEPQELVDDQEADQVNDQADDDADDSDDEGSQDEAAEDDTEEVEHGGAKYRIPKALKPALMMQADYTRKTQETAATARALDEERASWSRLSDEAIEARSEAKAVGKRLADIQALTDSDWDQVKALDRQDGGSRYDKLMRELNTLPVRLAEHEGASKAKEAEALAKRSESQTKLVEQGQAILARDIPGWGPDLGAKLVDFVKAEYGIDEQRHGAAFMDPALVKMAHAAYQAKAALRKTNAQDRAATAAKPVPQVKGGAAPKPGLHDNLSTDEWMRREREQQARKRGLPARRA